ncbi:MAG: hypothetical protein PVF17_04665 [Ignavibacteria bacterium]|jgi:hypothetical protein
MEWLPAVIGLVSALIVAGVSYVGIKKQINATIKTSTEQLKTSLDIAKLNLRGRIIWEQHQKWLYELSTDIGELLSKLQLIQDIIRTVSENKDDQNIEVQKILSGQIMKYMELTEKVHFLTDKIALQLDSEKGHHKNFEEILFDLTSEAVTVDFNKLDLKKVKELNTKCYMIAKNFIHKERNELRKEF